MKKGLLEAERKEMKAAEDQVVKEKEARARTVFVELTVDVFFLSD